MIVVRSTFTAKPGLAGKLAGHLKEMGALGKLRNCRVFTDLTGDFNTVVMEHDIDSMGELETLLQRYASDPQIRERAREYLELWTSGRRELFRQA